MPAEIIIPNQERLTQAVAAMRADGVESLHILADFDRTLTGGLINGQETPSIISVLYDENYLTPDYGAKARALAEKYRNIETDPAVSPADKKQAMAEWWNLHFDLLINSHLKINDIKQACASRRIGLRDGVAEFIKTLNDHHIPLVVMSATGLGEESIKIFLAREKCLLDNVYIAANAFNWDDQGQALSVRQPIITSYNKDETVLDNFPFFDQIKNRRNVLLLGDSIGDLGMITGFDYKQLVSIGFLNARVEANLPQFKANFDIIITDDGPLDYVNQLLQSIIKNPA